MSVKWTFEDYWASQSQKLAYYPASYVQTFTVPDDVYVVHFTMRGAWGGGNKSIGVASGGYVTGWVPCSPGDVFYLEVGEPGGSPSGSTKGAGGWPGGGDGGNGAHGDAGGYGGGGRSALYYQTHDAAGLIAVAAGGGGNSGNNKIGGVGGANQGGTGQDKSTNAGYSGHGGTQTAGGAHGTGGGTSGSSLTGGDASNTAGTYGPGGGGDGYYGGGAGGLYGSGSSQVGWPGGGGSNYVGGFDDSQYIRNEAGIITSTPTSPYIHVYYAQIPDQYTWEINPNEGGALTVEKNMNISQNSGPNRVNIVQEGQSQAPILAFSGAILTQDQLEQMELWFDRRTFIKMTDDLGREYYGVFSQFTPKRERRASNFWYHTYDAQFTASAYKNASGNWVYGRVL